MIRRSHARRSIARTSGFTLMEMMVVMVLLAIAASLVLPITVRAYANFKLRLTADSILGLMQRARSLALFEGRPYLLIFPEASSRDREVSLVREDGVSVAHYTLASDISLVSLNEEEEEGSADMRSVAFYPDGTSEALHLTLKGAGNSVCRIQLDPLTARAKIEVAREGQP